MSEEKFYELERLHDKIYEETQEYGRTQFVSRIVDLQQENQQLKQWDKNKDTRNSRQRVANAKLLKENQQLKEDYNCAFQDAEELNQRLKEVIDERNNLLSVLDEIREYIETHVKEHIHDDYDVTLYNSLNQDECDELLQILDKVKE